MKGSQAHRAHVEIFHFSIGQDNVAQCVMLRNQSQHRRTCTTLLIGLALYGTGEEQYIPV